MTTRDSELTRPTEALSAPVAQASGCVIRVVDGPDEALTWDLPLGSAVIGTSRTADLKLSDTSVSGKHLSISVDGSGLIVKDLDSTNGTFYLGGRITEVTLPLGAVIAVGRTRLRLASRIPAKASETYSLRGSYGRLIGSTPAMGRLYALLERLQGTDFSVLLIGETGTGKELVAQEIHQHSARKGAGFEIFDCAAVPANIVESELFGHVKGAFTGATSTHQGVFARARGGTVFLDEIGELPLQLQPKLLRVLESKSFRPVGGSQTISADFRLVAATNRDLAAEVKEGRFREDLFFRLNVVQVDLPPLRKRREDIEVLVRHFLKALEQPEEAIGPKTLEILTTGYDWPGNVRELRNAVARILAVGTLPASLEASESVDESNESGLAVDTSAPFNVAKRRLVEMFEREYVLGQLDRADNNIAKAARLSGMDRSYFKRVLKRQGLRDNVVDED